MLNTVVNLCPVYLCLALCVYTDDSLLKLIMVAYHYTADFVPELLGAVCHLYHTPSHPDCPLRTQAR